MRLRHLCEKLVIRDSGKVKKSARFQSMNFPFFITPPSRLLLSAAVQFGAYLCRHGARPHFKSLFQQQFCSQQQQQRKLLDRFLGEGGSLQLIGPLQRESYWYVDSLIIISPEKKNRKEKQQKKKHFRFFNHRIIPPINGGALYERDSAQGLIIILRSYMYVYKLSYREREREGDKVQVAHIVGKAKFHWAYRFPTSSS